MNIYIYRKFRTAFGGLVTLIIIFAVTSMVIYKVNIMASNGATQIQKNSFVSSSNGVGPTINLKEKGMAFAFSFTDYYVTNFYNNPKYGRFEVRQGTGKLAWNETLGTYKRVNKLQIVPYSKCHN